MSAKAHALIFGASGVSGWALVQQALVYPSRDTFERVTALTNRPLSAEDARFPRDGRLQLASGIDLTASAAEVERGLRAKVDSVDTVTHVFFTAYIEKADYPSLVAVNEALVRNAISAVDKVSPRLRSVILQTGGKYYGVEFVGKEGEGVQLKLPLSESAPRIPEPWRGNVFYYNQYDALAAMSEAGGGRWTFNEVRPDVIVGFTPGSNFMNVTQGLGFYLSLFREVHGEGGEVPFVGSAKAWTVRHHDTSQDVLARQEIHLAVHQGSRGITNGASYNCGDGAVVTWKDKWPGICAYFGLTGVGPGAESPLSAEQLSGFVQEHRAAWDALARKHDLKAGLIDSYAWKFIYGVTAAFDFDREYDLSAIRSTGFSEHVDTVKGYTTAFDRMREAKIIP